MADNAYESDSQHLRAERALLYIDRERIAARAPETTTTVTTTTTTTTVEKHLIEVQRELKYWFDPHFHPFVTALVRRLIEGSVRGLQDADTDYTDQTITDPDGKVRPRPTLYDELFSSDLTQFKYGPTERVQTPLPVADLDFRQGGAYAVYNWELFYHVPLTVAIHLSRNQRFEEAQKWFHFIFDPTDDSEGPTPERFWKVRPLQKKDVALIEEILLNLATQSDKALWRTTAESIQEWRKAPFRPHVVARFRQSAFMWKAVMAYLDNLIAWGDSLFRQDTGESINEATQIYILAANILGTRPQAVPKKGTVRPATYSQLQPKLDAFSNALVKLETDIPFDLAPTAGPSNDDEGLVTLRSLTQTLYFCVPPNEKLLAYWDIVADRLFKIRNSLNLQGVFRQLPLFEPPIDPALLAKATAAGLDVGAVVSGINQPLPLVRCQLLLQKATEITNEVKSLGGQLLAAIEKEDNEALAILRARHERVILGLAEIVRYSQWQEAIKAREGVEKSLANAAQRYTHYERLLGQSESEIKIPELEALDGDALAKLRLKVDEPVIPPREIPVDIDPGAAPLAEGSKLSHYETNELSKMSIAQDAQSAASREEKMASTMNIIPSFGISVTPFGVGISTSFGGSNIGAIFSAKAAGKRGESAQSTYESTLAAKVGGYARREQEWAFQSNLAAGEITQLYKQLRAAQIREAIAKREWENHQQQIKHAEEVEHFLTDERTGKRSNQKFYAWMKRETKGLYAQCFQLAFEVAKKAERALQHELGDPRLSFIEFGYLAGKEGLLAGEKLALDIKRMEMAYLELNRREYELTRHFSLAEIDPHALLQLRTVGRCTLALPEALFDLDCPGHFFRRLKTAAVSVPCVAGPYTAVPCTLTLVKSTVRQSPLLRDGAYAREDSEDDRFSDHFGNLQAVVTSTGQNDSGLFEVSLRDERFLPFEGSGAISEWQIELPSDVRQFDYDTISDVILHVRYTAREGGSALRNGAIAQLESAIADARAAGSVRLLSIRHEFPTEWADFKNAPAGPRFALTAPLGKEHYPFFLRDRVKSVSQVELFAKGAGKDVTVTAKADGTGGTATLAKAPPFSPLRWGVVAGPQGTLPLPQATGAFTVHLSDKSIDDLWMVLTTGQ